MRAMSIDGRTTHELSAAQSTGSAMYGPDKCYGAYEASDATAEAETDSYRAYRILGTFSRQPAQL